MKKYILDLTKELVAIPSVSSDIDQLHVVIDRVMKEFETLTLTLSQKERELVTIQKIVHNEKPSLVISNTGEKRGDICLNAHLDVVPASEDDQFVPREEDGKLYGRGTIDMKGAAVCMIAVMKDVLTQGIDKHISLILTCDEEVGGNDGAGYLASQGYGADVILTPDAAGIHRIVTAGKGVYTMSLEVPGTAAHSAYPWKGVNAIEQVIKLYTDLKNAIEESIELAQDDNRGTSVQLTIIQGGDALNAIPGICTCTINIRHTESYTETLLKNMCMHILKKYNATITYEAYGPLVFTAEDNPVIQKYKSCSDAVTEGDLVFNKMHGATDARYFSAKGAVTILHGPNGEYLHSPGEYVEIESLYTLYDITKSYVFTE